MAVESRVAAVTGANKGVGLAIVRQLALNYPKSPLRSGPLLIYLTARSPERGQEAVKKLKQDDQLKKAKALAEDGGDTTITYHAFDVSDSNSIRDFRAFLEKEHPDGIDFVINNAGIAMEGFDSNVVKTTLKTNYYGTLEATEQFLPILRKGGRLVNVSSVASQLHRYSDEVRQQFLQGAKTDVSAITKIMETFESAVKEGKEKEAGFPSAAYAVSKAGETAFTKAIAIREQKQGSNVLINACCPGRARNSYVNTDMTKGRGTKTPDQGAKTPVMLALDDIGGRTGDFWRDERVSQW